MKNENLIKKAYNKDYVEQTIVHPDKNTFNGVMQKIFNVKDQLFSAKDEEAALRRKYKKMALQRKGLETELRRAYEKLEQFRK